MPQAQQACTPVAVKATAGLRLLGESRAAEILGAVRALLKAEYPFPVDSDSVAVMDGADEGVYAWVTINFLLNLIGTTSAANATAAIRNPPNQ